MSKKKFLALIIFVGIGQIIALVLWFANNSYNYFLIMLISSLLGFIFGYRGNVKKE